MDSQKRPATSNPPPDAAASAAVRPTNSVLPNFPLPHPSSSLATNPYQSDPEYGFSYWNEQPPRQNDALPSHTLPSIQQVYEENFIDPRDTYRAGSVPCELPPVLPPFEDGLLAAGKPRAAPARAPGPSPSQQLPKIHTEALTHLPELPSLASAVPEPLGPADHVSISDEVAAAAGSAMRRSTSPSNLQRRSKKSRRKWTDAETEKLILATEKHGIGAWTTIAKDPAFVFNDRSAADLKDRFRTCAPPELLRRVNSRTTPDTTAAPSPSAAAVPSSSKRAAVSTFPSNILNPSAQDDVGYSSVHDNTPRSSPQMKDTFPSNILNAYPAASTSAPTSSPDLKALSHRPQRKRSHRRTMEDIQKLGITGPFKVAPRRERRRFTAEEDTCILRGLIQYGPQWSKIRNDTAYTCIQERHPTDLRDRVRNRFPDVFKALNAKLSKRGVEGFQPDGLEPRTIDLVEETLRQLAVAAANNSDAHTAEYARSETPDTGNVSAHTSDAGDDSTPAYNVLHLLQAD
ncbi:hypothetical protein BROUX41_001854 [Berkeleyomyces rouxiae]|uniref:uncharacterized protein n=1 Tax=Berkeleyomyces rouxiae TaxID=2035830 RepID=UPI003B7BF602